MGISDEKIKAALSKLENQKKNSFVEAVLKDLEAVNKVHDPILMLKRVSDLQEVFAMLDGKNKDGSLDVYQEIMASLSNAISEHVQILTEHAKESLSNIK